MGEKILKDTLSTVNSWDKQILFASADVPCNILTTFMAAIWDIYYIRPEELKTFNIFENMDYWTLILAVTCTVYGLLMWGMFDWIDSMYVNLLFVVVTGSTWPIEKLLGFSGDADENTFTMALILIGVIVSCVAYQVETKLEAQRKVE